ncbi:MAG: tetratricopeptide repeat protein [Acidobacteriota bacterium]
MAELTGDARIRDLKRRLELDPSSRLFVTLAEEYRKSGLLAEALSALQKGLLAHPHYLSAQVALGRAYLEAGQITEAIATFNKVLSNDPGNLVSAKSLADIYLSRGEGVEAIKKYKLYRALSGDRTVDEIVERLQAVLAPPPPPPARATEPLPPPPTFFEQKPIGPIRTSRELRFDAQPRTRASEIGESTSSIAPLSFELDDSTARRPPRAPESFGVPSRDNTPDHPHTSVLQSTPRRAAAHAVPVTSPLPLMAASVPQWPAPAAEATPGKDANPETVSFSPPTPAGTSPAEAAPAPALTRQEAWPSPLPAAVGADLPTPVSAPWQSGPASGGELRSPDVGQAVAGEAAPEVEDLSTRAFRIADILPLATAGNGQPEEEGRAEVSESDQDQDQEARDEPSGRTLADLYFAQGHYAEALDIYDELVAANPFDGELKRLRRDAEARLLPAATAGGHADADSALNRRLSRVRALKQWLSVVQAG